MSKLLLVLRDLVLLIVRIALGGMLILHGYLRWHDQGIAKQVDYLKTFGTPYPSVAAWGGTILELVGGLFILVGALTPLVALAILIEQILIISYTNWHKWVDLVNGGSYTGFESNALIGLLALLLMVFGAGRIAIDRLFRRKKVVEDDPDSTVTAPRVGTGASGYAGSSATR